MTHKIFFIFSLIFFSISVSSQEIETGNITKLERREYISKVIGKKGDSLYVLKKQKSAFSSSGFIIQEFNQDLNKVREFDVKIPKSTNENSPRDVFILNNDIYAFYQSDNKISKTLSAKIINLTTNEKHTIEELSYIKSGNKPTFNLNIDSLGVLLVTLPPFDKNANQSFYVKYFDNKLNPIVSEKIELPYSSKNFTLVNSKATENSIYFLGNSSSAKDFQNPQRFYLIRYNFQNKTLKEFELALKNKWITSATFELGQNNDLYVGGFYSNDRSFSVAGTFFLKIDLSNNEIIQKSLKAFSDDFLSKFLPPRKIKKGGELQSFYFDHFLISKNGEATFVAEQYYKSVSSFTDISSGLINYTTTYFYNDIIVVHANEEGEIEWNVKIPKKQYSTNDNGIYSSYTLGYKNDEISIIFNDHPKNIGAKDRDYQLRYMNNPYRAIPILVSIDNSGLTSYKRLNFKTGALILRPKKAYSDKKQDQLYFISEKGRNISLSRMKL